MVFAALAYVGMVVLIAKSLWNLSVPYISHRRHMKGPKNVDHSVSLHITLDLVAFLWTVLFLLLADDAYLVGKRITMILLCLAIPVASYICLTAFGMLLRKLYRDRYDGFDLRQNDRSR